MNKSQLEEIINSPISTPEQREKATALLSSLKPAPAPALPEGSVTLHYDNAEIVISSAYAQELAKTHGNVYGKAAYEEARLVLLLSQLYFNNGLDGLDDARHSMYSERRAADAARFPEREANYQHIFGPP